jgi:hypothetical protein
MSVKSDVMDVLREEITEDKTDQLLDYLFAKLPVSWYIKPFLPIARNIADSMLPERLLDGIEMLLYRSDTNNA